MMGEDVACTLWQLDNIENKRKHKRNDIGEV
jgi:hypothetical protein